MRALRFLIPGLVLLVSCAIPTPSPIPARTDTAPPKAEADTIFFNGIILTMESTQPQTQAIALQGDKILAVGSDDQILALRGPSTQAIDLGGLTLMPGFVDAHTHLLNDAAYFGTDLAGVQQLALENGITTIGNLYTSPEFLEEMRQFDQAGRLRLRTSLYLIHNTNCGEEVGDWWLEVQPTRLPGEMLRIGGVKIFADGGSCNRPALSYEVQPGSGYGDLYLTGDQIGQVISTAQTAGHQVAIHALGDRAIEAALDGIGIALAGEPNTYRHRIEHNAIIRPDMLARYEEVGPVVTIFATFPSCTPFGNPSPPPYDQWEWAWRSLIDSNPGLHVAWHGDDPYIQPVSPILELYGFLTRKQALDDRLTVCEPPAWLGDDTLTVEEALPLMTYESAYALFRDEEVGTLRPGKYADLVILSRSPLTEDPETLLDTRILVTLVGGRVEYCSPDAETLCP